MTMIFCFFTLLVRCAWFFFFSSRRRHTRLQGDWSSDVCSSDLVPGGSSRGPTACWHPAAAGTSRAIMQPRNTFECTDPPLALRRAWFGMPLKYGRLAAASTVCPRRLGRPLGVIRCPAEACPVLYGDTVTTTKTSKSGPVRGGAVGEPPTTCAGVTPLVGMLTLPPP